MGLATGVFNASTGNPAELNARSFASSILRLFPNGSAPLFGLTSMSGRSKAKSSTHGYFSKTLTFLVKAPAAQVLVGAGSMDVDSTTGMTVGMLFHNQRTREIVRVTAITDSNTVAITRAFGRVAAAQMETTDTLIHIGSAFEEGSNRPSARRLTTQYVPNYTQIFRNAWALTDTARASYAEMGISNIAENRKDCMMFHSVDIESAIVWGQPLMDTSGTQPMHSTQGILDAIEQYAPGNSNAAAATTTYAQLVALLDPAFEYSTDIGNPKERIVLGDAQALRVITDVGRKSGVVQIMQSETSFGMRFTKMDFYRGTVNLIEHPLFNGLEIAGMALIVDLPALKLAYMDGRDTRPEEYGMSNKSADNGADAQGGSLTTELAVELINPYSCGVITGLTEGVA
jgi:hypothetical protein